MTSFFLFFQKLFLVLIAFQFYQLVTSEIIGSSVVTSISVVLGNEEGEKVTPPTVSTLVPKVTQPTTPSMFKGQEPRPPKIVMVIKNTTDPGVLSLIATLKSIVEEEHQKHSVTTTQVPSTTLVTTTTQSVGRTTLLVTTPIDDDEADETVLTNSTTNISIYKPLPTDFPSSMVVKSFEMVQDLEGENETATSAEVHAAIHRISGALLTPGKQTTKPIENILTDVLTSINGERKESTTSAPIKTNQSETTSLTIGSMVNKSKEPEIGATVIGTKGYLKVPEGQSDESHEVETEEDTTLAHTTTTKPKRKSTSRIPIHYVTKPSKKNVSNIQNRPTEFYDDEIFGFDPYQTFLHGVYVAPTSEEKTGVTTPMSHVPHHYHVVTHMKHPSRPFHQNHRTKTTISQSVTGSGAKVQKPIPSLPDHLHRPRPSHLQYQHSAADTVDEAGLTAVKFPHPAEKFVNINSNLEADKLTPLARPILPSRVVQNLTHHTNPAHRHQTFGNFPTAAHGSSSHVHGGNVVRTSTEVPLRISGSSLKANGISVVRTTTQRTMMQSQQTPMKNVYHEYPHGSHGSGDKVEPNLHLHSHGYSSEKNPSFPKPPVGNPGLEGTVTNLDPEMKAFVNINNGLALRLFTALTTPHSTNRVSYKNVVLSPFTVISSLAMLFLGARGSTAAELDKLLNLDEQLTFNPHLMYHNVTQSFLSQSKTAAAVIRLLIADKNKGDVLDFFKMRVEHFYDARVEEADYKYAGHLAQSIINQMIRAQIQQHRELLNSSLPLVGPLSLLTAAFFDGQFGGSRDHSVHEMDFSHMVELSRQLIPTPALAIRSSFRAAYDESLDATAVEVPYTTRDLSLIFLLPGKTGEFPIGGINALKSRLSIESWTGLMRSFAVREPFKLIFPRFRHHSTLNLTEVIQRLGQKEIFRPHLAKFKGINGLSDLYIDPSLMHFAEISTEEKLADSINEAHKKFDLLRPHMRGEPLSINDWLFMSMSRNPPNGPVTRVPFTTSLPPLTYTRLRSNAKGLAAVGEPLPEEDKVLRLQRPFLYVLRHNPTGIILMIGQYMEPQIPQTNTS